MGHGASITAAILEFASGPVNDPPFGALSDTCVGRDVESRRQADKDKM